jgi:hypothetical protein
LPEFLFQIAELAGEEQELSFNLSGLNSPQLAAALIS